MKSPKYQILTCPTRTVNHWSKYQGTTELWLRLFDEDGELIPNAAEAGQAEAEAERQRADRLAAQLRALGVEPEE